MACSEKLTEGSTGVHFGTPETVWRTMGKSLHWPQDRIPVLSEWRQNRGCVIVRASRFSCLFV